MLTQTNVKMAEKTLQATSLEKNLLASLPAEMIKIRHAVLADAQDLLQLLSEPSVAKGLHQLPYYSLDALRDRLARPSSQGCLLVACCHEDIVGMVDLVFTPDPRRRHTATLQLLAVNPSWQGLGIGDRLMQVALDTADRWCNIHRLELKVFADNHRAISLYQKFGFIREGTLKAYAFREGTYSDVEMMARLHPFL